MTLKLNVYQGLPKGRKRYKINLFFFYFTFFLLVKENGKGLSGFEEENYFGIISVVERWTWLSYILHCYMAFILWGAVCSLLGIKCIFSIWFTGLVFCLEGVECS